MQRCFYKCHSLNGNAVCHVILPGESKSKDEHSRDGKTNFSGALKLLTS